MSSKSPDGVQHPLPYDDSVKEKARRFRTQPTPAEKLFWKNLKAMPFYKSLTFNRQNPIEPYIVDFYCHKLRPVIEIDGDSHGETKTIATDQKRTKFLKSKGMVILRFTNAEVNKNIAGVMEKLEDFIEKRLDVNHPSPL